LNQLQTSSEPADVMAFGFKRVATLSSYR